MEQDDDEGEEETVPLQTDESAKNRWYPVLSFYCSTLAIEVC